MPERVSPVEDSIERFRAIQDAVDSFGANAGSVSKLINLDREVVELAVHGVKSLHEKLLAQGFMNQALNAHNTLLSLQRIREHGSLQPRYKVMFNQAVVLLVSYFASALHDLFRTAVAARLLLDDGGSALMREELKLSFRKIRERGWDLRAIAADLLVEQKDLTFQDMKSTAEAFRDYVGIRIERDEKVNNIIVAQASRHVIVHAGHQVTQRMLHQIRDCQPRRLKPTLQLGELVQFSPDEIDIMANSMKDYVSEVATSLRDRV